MWKTPMRHQGSRDPKRIRRTAAAAAAPVRFETLEVRALLSASSVPSTFVARPELTLKPSDVPAAAAFAPAQIRAAYGFDQVTFANGTVTGDGSGQTIAIVDAFHDPNLAGDLQLFDQRFGLADPPGLRQVDQAGGGALPAQNAAWAAETALDVEWAHAMAPRANILVVEASSDQLDDLMSAVDTARNAIGVSVVSMSWGGNEFGGQLALDNLFTTPAGHPGVSFVASSGDDGWSGGPKWPASSGNVISVGGTSLRTDAQGQHTSEQSWSGSSGGASAFESEPSYQANVQNSGARFVPDVSYSADPASGYYVYDSIPLGGVAGWQVSGGTSAGAPQWAALIAVANQGRAVAGLPSLDGATQTLPALYKAGSSGFNAISQGTGSFIADAQSGYQPATGLGTPQAPIVTGTVESTVPPVPTGVFSVSGLTHRHRHVRPNVQFPPNNSGGRPLTQPPPAPIVAARAAAAPSSAANRTAIRPDAIEVAPVAPTATSRAATAATSGDSNAVMPSSTTLVTRTYRAIAQDMLSSAVLIGTAGEVAARDVAGSFVSVAHFVVPPVSQAAGELADAAANAPATAVRTVTTFIHANALSAFADATAAFIHESASLPVANGSPIRRRIRAAAITAGVIAADALLVAHWHATRPRTQRRAKPTGDAPDAPESAFPFFVGEPLPARR